MEVANDVHLESFQYLRVAVFGTAEDCNVLDIYRPHSRQKGKLPVMVWLHGGALTQGAASFYPGAALVQESSNVVSHSNCLGKATYSWVVRIYPSSLS